MTSTPESSEGSFTASSAVARRSPLAFFLLVAVLSVPFALLGATGIQLYPGIPISALGFVAPVSAAAILLFRERGVAGVTELLRRAADLHRITDTRWYVAIVLVMPAFALATWAVMRAMSAPHPTPRFPLPGALILFLAFIVAALGEELGWSGYAIDPLQKRFSTLTAALILGAYWAAWHIIAMVQAGQSPEWIAWGCLDMIGTRVLMVWIYNNTGRSVAAVALYHAIANLTLKSVFPGGSYEAERIISVIIAIAAAIVVMVWGPRTLTREHS
jgi:hypothetical protein